MPVLQREVDPIEIIKFYEVHKISKTLKHFRISCKTLYGILNDHEVITSRNRSKPSSPPKSLKPVFDQVEEAYEYYMTHSMTSTALKYQYSGARLITQFKARNLPMKPKIAQRELAAKVIPLLGKFSVREICKSVNVSRTSVYNLINAHNLKDVYSHPRTSV